MLHQQNGFNLLEVLVVLIILVISLAYSVPSLILPVFKSRAEAWQNKFSLLLDIARSEAMRQGETVLICPAQLTSHRRLLGCGKSWNDGILAYVDYQHNGRYNSGNRIKFLALDKLTIVTEPNQHSLEFTPQGELLAASNLRFCSKQEFLSVQYQTCLKINRSGLIIPCD